MSIFPARCINYFYKKYNVLHSAPPCIIYSSNEMNKYLNPKLIIMKKKIYCFRTGKNTVPCFLRPYACILLPTLKTP